MNLLLILRAMRQVDSHMVSRGKKWESLIMDLERREYLKQANNLFSAFCRALQVAVFQRVLGFACRAFWAGKEDTNSFRHNSFLDQEDIGLRLDYDFLDTGKISFDILHVNSERGTPGAVNEDENWRVASEDSDWQRDRQTRASLGLDFGNWQNINLKVDIYKNYDKMEFWDNSISTMSLHDDWERGIQSHIAFPFGDWQILSAGADFFRQQSSSSELGNNHITRSSVFIQDEISLLDSIIITAGARYDKHSLYANKFNPRVSGAVILPWETKLRASWGKAYRAPTLNDLYWPSSAYFAGNPDLEAESGKAYEFGLEQSWGEEGFLGLTYFERKVDDLIEWAAGSDNIWRPSNVAKTRINGLEIDFQETLLDRVDIITNYTYAEWGRGISPPPSPQTVREPLDSYGSHPAASRKYLSANGQTDFDSSHFWLTDSSQLNTYNPFAPSLLQDFTANTG